MKARWQAFWRDRCGCAATLFGLLGGLGLGLTALFPCGFGPCG